MISSVVYSALVPSTATQTLWKKFSKAPTTRGYMLVKGLHTPFLSFKQQPGLTPEAGEAWTCPRGHSAGKQPAELTPGRPAMAGFNMASGELGPRLAFLGGG